MGLEEGEQLGAVTAICPLPEGLVTENDTKVRLNVDHAVQLEGGGWSDLFSRLGEKEGLNFLCERLGQRRWRCD